MPYAGQWNVNVGQNNRGILAIVELDSMIARMKPGSQIDDQVWNEAVMLTFVRESSWHAEDPRLLAAVIKRLMYVAMNPEI